MSSVATLATETKTRGRRRVRQVLPRVAEILLLVIALLCVAILVTQDLATVVRFFYSPVAIVLLVVVFVTYLIVKGGDRSRLYRIEIERLHEREQESVARTRRAVEEIGRALERSQEVPLAKGEQASAAELAAADLQESLRRVERILRLEHKE